MSLENIVINLEKLEKMHKSLLESAMKKTDFIKQNDMEQLDQMLKHEQAHVAAIETLEQQRQLMVTEYLRANGIALTDNNTVADVLTVAIDGEWKNRLASVREKLMQVLDQLRNQNELNQKLIFNSLQIVNVTLDAMRPARQQQFNYSGAEVRGDSVIGKKSYYDSQA